MINKSKLKSEKGVTLMVLVVSVIILLIISVIVITNFRGEDVSLINSIEDKKNELSIEKARQNVEVTAEKIKMQKSNIENYNITSFCNDLQIELRKNDLNAIVTASGAVYNVNYSGYNFTYNY